MAVPDVLPEIATGDGPAVVLIHGWGGFKEGWGRLPQEIAAAGMRAVTVDLPGWGEAPAPFRFAHRPEDYAAALGPTFARHQPAAVIGHSMGCPTALLATIAHSLPALVALAPQWSPAPKRPLWSWRGVGRMRPGGVLLTRLGLLAARRDHDAIRDSFLAAVARPDDEIDDPLLRDLLAEATRRFAATDTRTLATSIAPLLAFDARPIARELAASTLVVLGERDRVVNNAAAAWAIAPAPRVEVMRVDGIAHFPHFEASVSVVARVIAHLREAVPA